MEKETIFAGLAGYMLGKESSKGKKKDKWKTKSLAEEIEDDIKKDLKNENKSITALKLRYAKGEITKEKYFEMKKELET